LNPPEERREIPSASRAENSGRGNLSRPKSLVGRTIVAHSSIRANPVFHLFAVRTLRSRHAPKVWSSEFSRRNRHACRNRRTESLLNGDERPLRFTRRWLHAASHSGLPSPLIQLRLSDGLPLAMGSAAPQRRSAGFPPLTQRLRSGFAFASRPRASAALRISSRAVSA